MGRGEGEERLKKKRGERVVKRQLTSKEAKLANPLVVVRELWSSVTSRN